MEDRFVTLLAMAMAATHATFTARTRPTRHAAHRPLLAWCTQHERALPPASHAVAHNTMAPASLWLQICTQAVILLGCVAVCCRAFLRCTMARILLPLSSLALLSSTFFVAMHCTLHLACLCHCNAGCASCSCYCPYCASARHLPACASPPAATQSMPCGT